VEPLLDEPELVPEDPELLDEPELVPEEPELVPEVPEVPEPPDVPELPPAAATAPPLTGELMLVVVPDEVDV
jgi:hypothetical protein